MIEKLEVIKLNAVIENKHVLKDISFELNKDEVVVLMGPNGAGKSTISNVLMGNPKYQVNSGKIKFDGEDITKTSTEYRAKKGLFMSFQHPIEINGVTFASFLRTSYNLLKENKLNPKQFYELLDEKMKILDFDKSFRKRFVNAGFSGGEKKKAEILQLLLFEPEYVILDEIDSGLDVDALKIVSNGINKIRKEKKMGILIVTHYHKILEYIKPDRVIVLKEGRIEKQGDSTLANEILDKGFE